MGKISPLMPDLLFKVVDVAANLGALGAKGGNDMGFGYDRNLRS